MMFAAVLGCEAYTTDEGTNTYLDDAAITARVKIAISSEPTLKSNEIGVETCNGTVQLSGFVKTTTEIYRASDVARGVNGVVIVKNDIRMKN